MSLPSMVFAVRSSSGLNQYLVTILEGLLRFAEVLLFFFFPSISKHVLVVFILLGK